MSEFDDDVLNDSDADAESMTAAEVLKALEDVSFGIIAHSSHSHLSTFAQQYSEF